jgi:hypothetical protein
MPEAIPRWRLLLCPPFWLQLTLAVGPFQAVRMGLDRNHPIHSRRAIQKCRRARAAYQGWLKKLGTRARHRLYWGLPTERWRPSAQIVRPLKFHPELARVKREQDEMREWSLRTGRDPLESPIFQARLRKVKRLLAGGHDGDPAPPANDD